jgi:ABC-type branched-subunit amino acid transport system substrate-binding protein
MVIPINSSNIQPIKPKLDTAKLQSAGGDDFKNLFKTTAAQMYSYVPEALAPYREQFKKQRIEEDEPLWATAAEDESTDNVQALLKKIDDRLKKLRQYSDEVN